MEKTFRAGTTPVAPCRGRRVWAVAVAAWLAWTAGAGAEPFRVVEPPPPTARPVATVAGQALQGGEPPAELLERAAAALASGGGLLFVGRTDPVGPRPVNQELGRMWAEALALGTARALGVEPRRFAVASAGEGTASEVRVYPWSPPGEARARPGPVTVLEPGPGVAPAGRVWALGRPAGAVWAEADGQLWRYRPAEPLWTLPVPVGGAGLAAAAAGGVWTRRVGPAGPRWDALRARVEAQEDWWATLRVEVPEGARDPVVWAGGIPYPVAPGAGDVPVLLFPSARQARLEATDAEGRRRGGPGVALPAGQGEPPRWALVLSWEGASVDLDLWVTDGRRRTGPARPDPLFDPGAVDGVRLLFDGGVGGSAAAVAGWRDPSGLRAWVTCFSDLGGGGARARAYLVENPGDPLEGTIRFLGVRKLSLRPVQAAWRVWERGR